MQYLAFWIILLQIIKKIDNTFYLYRTAWTNYQYIRRINYGKNYGDIVYIGETDASLPSGTSIDIPILYTKGNSTTRNSFSPALIPNGFRYIDTTIYKELININATFREFDSVIADTKRFGTFSEKPTVQDNKIYIGFRYFCTDKQTTEGATNGIEIIHKGNNVWVDSLGRTIS